MTPLTLLMLVLGAIAVGGLAVVVGRILYVDRRARRMAREERERRGTPATTPYEHGVGDILLGDRPLPPLPPVFGHVARPRRPPVTLGAAKRRTAGDILAEHDAVKPTGKLPSNSE